MKFRVAGWMVLATALAGLYPFCVLPFECNRTLKIVEARSRVAAGSTDAVQRAHLARSNLAQLDRVRSGCMTDVNTHLLSGLNAGILGRYEQALAHFGAALRVDDRPEIYFNRGLVLLELGRTDDAVTEFAAAVRFSPHLLESVDSRLRARVARQAGS